VPEVTDEGAGGVLLRWSAAGGPGGTIGLRFTRAADHFIDLAVESTIEGARVGELSWNVGPAESFIGLGTQTTGMDLRGRRYRLWTQEQGIGKPEGDSGFPLANAREAAYAPMGVLHSSAGYSVYAATDAVAELELASESGDRATFRSAGELPALRITTWQGADELSSRLTEVVGPPPDVPDWAFAPWNHAVGGPAELRRVAELLRSEGVPSSAIWSEDWIGGSQTATGFRLSYAWEWSAAQYPDLPGDIAWLHARGFAFLGYFNPFVPSPTRMFQEGVAGGFLVLNDRGQTWTTTDPAFRQTSMVDLTNPAAVAWHRGYLDRAATEVGLDGWMADFAEWLPLDGRLASGDPWLEHNRYPLRYQAANRDSLDAAAGDGPQRRLFFSRSGWASTRGATASTAPVLWAGDQNTDWSLDDGYPSVVPISVHVAAAGVSMFGSDIAGYTSVTVPNTTKELFYRWTTMGAFHPVMRTHHGSDKCGNWSFDRDTETTAHFRRYASIHTRLFPYLREGLRTARAGGGPIIRHPFFEAPRSNWVDAGYAWFVGPAMLVAPVLDAGATSRTTALPSGSWWPLFGGERLDLGVAPGPWVPVTVDAPPTEIPVFVRAGTALPLLPRVPDSFYGATETGVTQLSQLGGSLEFALYPTVAGNASGSYGEARVTAEAVGDGAAPFAGASVLGVALPTCTGIEGESCVSGDGRSVLVIGDARIEAGASTVEVSGSGGALVRVSSAAAAWGDLARATELTNLSPDIPPPCEAE
jgi:alpha-glucosidase